MFYPALRKADDEVSATSKMLIVRLFAQTMVAGLVATILLFISAGRLHWFNGWIYAVLWFLSKIVYLTVFSRRYPTLLVERTKKHANTKDWDKLSLLVYSVLSFITLVIAGLDAGRFRWSGPMSTGLQLVGIVIYLATNGLAVWAMAANPFHSSVSRIQAERGHEVVASGPYQYVRHPTYLATALIWLSTPLILGSWWALIPGSLAAVVMGLRTFLEDRMLKEELPGYVEYAHHVRYRVLPGIW